MTTSSLTPKNFWDKTEGKTGMIVIGLLIVAAVLGFFSILPALIALVSNVIYLGVLIGILACAGILLTNKSFQAAVAASFQIAMRQLTNAVVTIDPIGVIENYLQKLEGKMDVMQEKRGELQGSVKQLEMRIQQTVKDMERALKLTQAAKQQGQDDVAYVQSRQAGRLEKTVKDYQESLQKLVSLEQVITKMYKAARVVLDDQKNELADRKIKYESIKQAHAAFQSAKSVIAGNADERALFEAGCEEVAQQIANNLGEIERFLEDSSTFLNGIDVENAVMAKSGDDLLNRWLEKGTSGIVNPTAVITYQPGTKLDLGVNLNTGSKYLNLTQTVKK